MRLDCRAPQSAQPSRSPMSAGSKLPRPSSGSDLRSCFDWQGGALIRCKDLLGISFVDSELVPIGIDDNCGFARWQGKRLYHESHLALPEVINSLVEVDNF